MSTPGRLAAALLAGATLAAAFPRANVDSLAWVGLAPLLVVMRGCGLRESALLGWATGFAFFLASLYWIPDTISRFTTIDAVTATGLWVLMAAASANAHAFFAVGVEWLARRGTSRLLLAPLVWAVVEWSRTWFLMGFPWNSLGYALVRTPVLAQLADVGGVYLLSAVIVLGNAALAEAWWRWRGRDTAGGAVAAPGDPRGSALPVARMLVLAVACPFALFAYGGARLRGLESVPWTGSLRVAIAQGNIAQDQKWDETLQDRIFARYLALSEQAADAGARLVVWPEASLPFYFRYDPRTLQLVDLARRRGIDLLVGTPGYEDRGDGQGLRDRNQAWLIRAGGDLAGPYDKIQLVPFGEYIPLYGLFGMVDIAVESVGQMARGSERVIFESAPLEAVDSTAAGTAARFGVLICYEAIFPALTREFAASDADFLVNISNDAWYGDSAAPDQHLVMSALRAIENRMPLVRSTNTGFSAFVTDTGAMGSVTGLFREEMVTETVLVRDAWSFYRLYGDVFVYACLVGLALVALRRTTSRGLADSTMTPEA